MIYGQFNLKVQITSQFLSESHQNRLAKLVKTRHNIIIISS